MKAGKKKKLETTKCIKPEESDISTISIATDTNYEETNETDSQLTDATPLSYSGYYGILNKHRNTVWHNKHSWHLLQYIQHCPAAT